MREGFVVFRDVQEETRGRAVARRRTGDGIEDSAGVGVLHARGEGRWDAQSPDPVGLALGEGFIVTSHVFEITRCRAVARRHTRDAPENRVGVGVLHARGEGRGDAQSPDPVGLALREGFFVAGGISELTRYRAVARRRTGDGIEGIAGIGVLHARSETGRYGSLIGRGG